VISEGQNIFEKVLSALPDEVNHNMLEHIMKSTIRISASEGVSYTVYINTFDIQKLENNRVPFVKCLRSHTGMSLKGAVDILKNLTNGNVSSVAIRENGEYGAGEEFEKYGVTLTF
jgi:intergrase/recombinase